MCICITNMFLFKNTTVTYIFTITLNKQLQGVSKILSTLAREN